MAAFPRALTLKAVIELFDSCIPDLEVSQLHEVTTLESDCIRYLRMRISLTKC
jgi:hypothetical protein